MLKVFCSVYTRLPDRLNIIHTDVLNERPQGGSSTALGVRLATSKLCKAIDILYCTCCAVWGLGGVIGCGEMRCDVRLHVLISYLCLGFASGCASGCDWKSTSTLN